MTGIMGDRKPSSDQPTASLKGRKRKHSEMLKEQFEALKQQNGLQNLIDLVQGPVSDAYGQRAASYYVDVDKPSQPNNDLIMASQEVSQALNSLLDKLPQ